MVQRFGPLLNPGGSVLSLTYVAADRVIPGYGGGMSSAKVGVRLGGRGGGGHAGCCRRREQRQGGIVWACGGERGGEGGMLVSAGVSVSGVGGGATSRSWHGQHPAVLSPSYQAVRSACLSNETGSDSICPSCNESASLCHDAPPLLHSSAPSPQAALESDTRVLAYEAGRKYGVRVNTISAGPLGSRAAKAIGFIDDMIRWVGGRLCRRGCWWWWGPTGRGGVGAVSGGVGGPPWVGVWVGGTTYPHYPFRR